jgi:hypothetical protein
MDAAKLKQDYPFFSPSFLNIFQVDCPPPAEAIGVWHSINLCT